MSCLYMVATPIGNLGDITLRALETLKSVEAIACEDTRHTLHLLTHFDIKKPLISCRAQNEKKAAREVIALLREDKDVAFVSDAGSPCISDPGFALSEAVKDAGYKISPIPGASALSSILSVSSSSKGVTFIGFLSVKEGKRRRELEKFLAREEALVMYESPFRIVKLLKAIADIDSKRQLILAREMTKIHEEFIRGSAEDVLKEMEVRESIKGEFTLYVAGKKKEILQEGEKEDD